jgi:sorbitol/mannitol transport system substrate-binding protein
MQRVHRGTVALLALVALIAAACSGAGNGLEQADPLDTQAGDAEPADTDADAGEEAVDGDRTTVTVAVVNNPQMEDIQSLIGEFHDSHPDVHVNFVTLPENELRDQVTQDIATEAGQFDAVMIGTYEVPIWQGNGWLAELESYATADTGYDVDDLVPAIRAAISVDDQLYAVPFYAESSFLMYRQDLFDEAGLEMPERPTWDEVAGFARELHSDDVAGICLRGLPGWGQQLAPLNTVVNTFGGQWFDVDWNPQLTADPFVEAVEFYVDLLDDAGQPGAANAGFNECLTAYTQGNAAMWVDATVAAGILEDPDSSNVVGQNGYAHSPVKETDASGWLWAWTLAIPETSENKDETWQFLSWATSKDYIQLAGEELGWARVPPGSRLSTYEIPEYQEAAGAFADLTLEAIQGADIENPGVAPRPYVGVQYVAIPEFQSLGTAVSQEIAAAITGQQSVRDALERGQELAEQVADDGGYR